MMRMVRSCDRTQRKFAAFLLTVMVTEILIICSIVGYEHRAAHAEQRTRLKTRLLGNSSTYGSNLEVATRQPVKKNRSLIEVSREDPPSGP